MLIDVMDYEDVEQNIALREYLGVYSEECEMIRDKKNMLRSIYRRRMREVPWIDIYSEKYFEYEIILDRVTIEQVLHGRVRNFALLLLKNYRIADIVEIMDLSRTELKRIINRIYKNFLK